MCVFFFSQQTEVTSPADSEDRTPGRLQAVWPPPKPKDEEEKVGLKYTEAGKDLKLIALPELTSKTRNADRGSRLFKLAHNLSHWLSGLMSVSADITRVLVFLMSEHCNKGIVTNITPFEHTFKLRDRLFSASYSNH